MVTRRRMPTILAHLVLMTGVCIIVFPVWMALVASTHPPEALSINPIPMWFGGMGPENYTQLLSGGIPEAGGVSVGLMMTCLLYTSPSPRDVCSSRMPSSA